MRLVFFWGIDFAGHFTPDIFQGANFGQHIIDRLVGNVAIGTLGANTFIVLEMHTALIFRQRLLHGMTRHAEFSVAGFMHDSCRTRQQHDTNNDPNQQGDKYNFSPT